MLHYTEVGKGNPLVLLHGFLETHAIWENFAKELSSSCRVISVDLPGFGKSPLPPQPFTLSDVATQVLSTLSSLTNEKIGLLGHSLGGYISLAMVELQPEIFSSFGLFHSSALADSPEKKEARTKTINFVNRNGALAFTANFIPQLFANPHHEAIAFVTKIAATTHQKTVVSYLEAMRDRPDRTHVLKNFNGPILFMTGTKDSLIPVNSLEKQSKPAKNAFLEILENVGHMGMIEAHDTSAKVVSTFFKNQYNVPVRDNNDFIVTP